MTTSTSRDALRQFRYHGLGPRAVAPKNQGDDHGKLPAPARHLHRNRARWTSRGDAPAVAAAIAGAVIGYFVQSAFSHDDIDPKQYCKGFSRLK